MTISTADFVGLSDLVYNALPKEGSILNLNGKRYQVLKTSSTPSDYQGMVLFSVDDNALIVVNRGTSSARDGLVDGEMVANATSAQWNDALALSQYAAQQAKATGAPVYATGHSLGGTLTQLEAAKFGWTGVTFNAFGAYELAKNLNIKIAPSSITNYRTMFDIVSDVSTHIGDVPITLATANDASIVASSFPGSTNAFGVIASDHSMSNFFVNSSATNAESDALDHTFVINPSFNQPLSRQKISLAQDLLNGAAKIAEVALLNAPGTDLDSNRIRAELNQWLSNSDLSGIRAFIPASTDLLSNALTDAAYANQYRASLVALSPVALSGSPNALADYGLWKPGRVGGYTAEYLAARAAMVSARVTLAAAGLTENGALQTHAQDTYIYTDFSHSLSPLYTLQGDSALTHVVSFAADSGTGLTVPTGADAQLFGGRGDDTLFGGASNDTLQGGTGRDDYRINGAGSGTDSILDTDAKGLVEWLIDGATHLITGGVDLAGTSYWRSTDGLFTFDEDLAADGSTELEIRHGSRLVTIDNFTNGDLGITLGPVGAPPSGASNLSGLHKIAGNGFNEYQDLSGASSGHLDTIYGAKTTGGPFNLIEGYGHAGLIVAGDGNNQVFADQSGEKASTSGFVTPIDTTIQGGHGNQLLVGLGNGHETIIGGSTGNADGWDSIDGAGAAGLLSGGSQNTIIFAGTGAVTARGASATSSAMAAPSSIILGGLSFWGDQLVRKNGVLQVSGEPAVSTTTPADPSGFQVNLQLAQLDGTYAAPVGLLGSTRDPSVVQGTAAVGQALIGGNGAGFLIGNTGNDTLQGGDPVAPKAGVIDTVMVGGAGSDLIQGGSGTEVIFADLSAAGSATWADDDRVHSDTIYGGSGHAYIYGSGGDTRFYGSTGDYTVFTGNGNAYVGTGAGTAIVYVGKGSDTILAQGTQQEIHLDAGRSVVDLDSGVTTVIAGAGDQTINGSGGKAYITEGSGNTTLFVDGSTDFEQITAASGATFIELANGISESDVVIRNRSGALVLTDHGFEADVEVAGYFNGSADVTLHFADGATWTRADFEAAAMRATNDWADDMLVGTTGNDSIVAGYGNTFIDGKAGNNTLVGGVGSDTLQGGGGADTLIAGTGATTLQGGSGAEHYVFNTSSGVTTLAPDGKTHGNDTLTFGAGIVASKLTYAISTGDRSTLNITVNGASTPAISIAQFLTPPGHVVSDYVFADGTHLTRTQVIDQLEHINGTSGADSLTGSFLPETIDGKGGNDVVYGQGGSDTFVFNPKYGSLEINESYQNTEAPVVHFGGGLKATQIHASMGPPSAENAYSAGDMILTDGVTGDRVRLDYMYGSSGSRALTEGVAKIVFDDGSSLTQAQLYAMAKKTTGSTGNDSLAGTKGADVFDGKGGDDYVAGAGGADTFVFNATYHSLEINESNWDAQTPPSTLKLGAGITAGGLTASYQLSATTHAHGLELSTDKGGSILIQNWSKFGLEPIDQVTLASGQVLTAAMVTEMAEERKTAADVLLEQGTKGKAAAMPPSARDTTTEKNVTQAMLSTPSDLEDVSASPAIGAGAVTFHGVQGQGSDQPVPRSMRSDAVMPATSPAQDRVDSHGRQDLAPHPSPWGLLSEEPARPDGLTHVHLEHLRSPADAGEPRRSSMSDRRDTSLFADDAALWNDTEDVTRHARASGAAGTTPVTGHVARPIHALRAAAQAASLTADGMLRSLGLMDASGGLTSVDRLGNDASLYLRDGGEWHRDGDGLAAAHALSGPLPGQREANAASHMHGQIIQAMAGLGNEALATTPSLASGSDAQSIAIAVQAA